MCAFLSVSLSIALSIVYLIGLLENSCTNGKHSPILLLFCLLLSFCCCWLLSLPLVHYIRCYWAVVVVLYLANKYALGILCIHGPMPINVYTFLARRKNSISFCWCWYYLYLLLCVYFYVYVFHTNGWLYLTS